MRWLSAPSCRPEISPTTHLDYRFVGLLKRHRSRIGRAAQTERSKCEARIDAEVGLILIWGGCTRRFAHDLSVRIANAVNFTVFAGQCLSSGKGVAAVMFWMTHCGLIERR